MRDKRTPKDVCGEANSEPTAGKSCEKWVKSRDMSQISKRKDLQWGLWVFSGGSRKGAQGALPSLIFRPN